MANIVNDVTGKVISAYIGEPFDEAKEVLEAEGYRIISLPEMARLRVQEGKDSSISQSGNWVREGFIYVPGRKVCIARHSPILDNANDAVKCSRNGQFYPLSDEQVEKALSESVEISYNQKPVPTKRFGDDEVTRFLFKEFAKEYGEFLKEAGVSEMPFYVVDQDYAQKQTKPFAAQAWLGSVDDRSELDGDDYGGLDGSSRRRGVKDSAEGTAPKNPQVESYTLKQIREALKRAKLQGIESILIDALKE